MPSNPTPLDESIAHWERMAQSNAATPDKPLANQCALCRTYADDDCNNCPVNDSHKSAPINYGCEGTPYPEAFQAYRRYGINSHEFRAAATLEVEFLRSLKS